MFIDYYTNTRFKIDQELEGKFIEYLQENIGYWQFYGKPYEVYQILGISTGKFSMSNLKDGVENYPSIDKPPFTPAIVHTTIMTQGPPIKIQVKKDSKDPRSKEQLVQEEIDRLSKDRLSKLLKEEDGPLSLKPSAFRIEKETTIQHYESMVSKYEKHDRKNKFKKAHKAISEVIKYNPFDVSLLLKRVQLEQELGINEFQRYDIPWIVVLRKLTAQGVI